MFRESCYEMIRYLQEKLWSEVCCHNIFVYRDMLIIDGLLRDLEFVEEWSPTFRFGQE